MGFFSQLRLLLWKNLLLQRRKVVVSIFEVLLPILFAVIVVSIRILTKPEKVSEPTIFNSTSPNGYNLGSFLGRVTEMGFTPDTPLTRRVMDNVLDDLIRYFAPVLPMYPDMMDSPPRVYTIGQFTNQTCGVTGGDQ